MKKPKLNLERRGRFLTALAETGIVSLAVKLAGTSRTQVYALRRRDEAFAVGWDEAEQTAADQLEAEAFRRGVTGYADPLVSGGKLVRGDDGEALAIQRYSDTLLLALLRARRPDQFRENVRIEHDVSDRVADRLEAARVRMLGQMGPPVIDLTPEPDRQ